MTGSGADNASGEDDAGEAKDYLNCAACKHPVARAEEIIEQKAETWKLHAKSWNPFMSIYFIPSSCILGIGIN